MPAGGHPKPSRQDEARPIQLERCHRGASSCRFAIDASSALGPCEVLRPFLQTGIEDTHLQTGPRIDDDEAVSFVAVTKGTGQPEVVFRRESAAGARKQMIDLHGPANHRFLGQAVTTAVSRLFCHSAAQVDGDMDGAHDGVRRLETSCPRSLRSLAAWARTNIERSYSRIRFARAASSSWSRPSSRCLRCRASSS